MAVSMASATTFSQISGVAANMTSVVARLLDHTARKRRSVDDDCQNDDDRVDALRILGNVVTAGMILSGMAFRAFQRRANESRRGQATPEHRLQIPVDREAGDGHRPTWRTLVRSALGGIQDRTEVRHPVRDRAIVTHPGNSIGRTGRYRGQDLAGFFFLRAVVDHRHGPIRGRGSSVDSVFRVHAARQKRMNNGQPNNSCASHGSMVFEPAEQVNRRGSTLSVEDVGRPRVKAPATDHASGEAPECVRIYRLRQECIDAGRPV